MFLFLNPHVKLANVSKQLTKSLKLSSLHLKMTVVTVDFDSSSNAHILPRKQKSSSGLLLGKRLHFDPAWPQIKSLKKIMKPKWRVVCFTNLFNPEGLTYSIKLETELFWGIYSQLTWTCSDSVMDAFHWPAAEWTQVTAHSTTLKGTTSLESHNNNTAVSFKRLTLTWSAASSFYRLIPTSPTSCTEGSFNSKWKTLPKQTGIQRNVQENESFRFSVRSNTSPRMVFNPQAAPIRSVTHVIGDPGLSFSRSLRLSRWLSHGAGLPETRPLPLALCFRPSDVQVESTIKRLMMMMMKIKSSVTVSSSKSIIVCLLETLCWTEKVNKWSIIHFGLWLLLF